MKTCISTYSHQETSSLFICKSYLLFIFFVISIFCTFLQKNMERMRKFLSKKRKRSLDKRHTKKQGSLIEMWCCLYCVFTYIYSLLLGKDICDHWNVSIKLLCVCVCLLSRNLLIFLVRVSYFFFYFLCYLYFVLSFPLALFCTFPFHMVLNIRYTSLL